VVIWVVAAMTFGAQVAVTVFMPTLLVSLGLDVSTALVDTMIINVGGLLGALLFTAFGYWFKRRVVLGGLLQLMFILLNTTFIWAPELYPTRVRAFGTGTMVTVFLLAASIAPLLAGAVADATGVGGVFLLVGVIYAIMAGTVWFGPETQGLSLEEVSEGRIGTDFGGR
jgi:putative MFS transporter